MQPYRLEFFSLIKKERTSFILINIIISKQPIAESEILKVTILQMKKMIILTGNYWGLNQEMFKEVVFMLLLHQLCQ